MKKPLDIMFEPCYKDFVSKQKAVDEAMPRSLKIE
jgi:hypothetical protein